MSRADLRRRVATLNQAINPAGSTSARLNALSDEQRIEYRRWKDRCERYYALNLGELAYARILLGEPPPSLRCDIRHILFGSEIRLSVDAAAGEVQAIYNRVAFGE